MEKKVSLVYIGSTTEVIAGLTAGDKLSLEVLPNALAAINFLNSGQKPDAILCESEVSGGSAFDIFDMLSGIPGLDHVAFIMIAFEFKESVFKKAFTLRIDDYYVAPLPPVEAIIGRVEFLREFRQKSGGLAEKHTPELTYKMPLSKRIFDIVAASTALILLSPVLLIVIIAIRVESRGKFYYISKRIGREPFDFYKLRSMRPGAAAQLDNLAKEKNQYSVVPDPAEVAFTGTCPECARLGHPCSKMLLKEGQSICTYWYCKRYYEVAIAASEFARKNPYEINFAIPCPLCADLPGDEPCSPMMHVDKGNICNFWQNFQTTEISKKKTTFKKISKDPRVTKVGKFIRNTSIDELPQLINVLKGDMSIVGNRPLPVYEAEMLTTDSLSKRFLAPAGITGLWQVELRGKGGVMSEDERKHLDNEYADHFTGDKYSFFYDLKLIFRTAKALFQKDSV
ncbi:MAG: sugar transferase [Bacteroidota bacterium]